MSCYWSSTGLSWFDDSVHYHCRKTPHNNACYSFKSHHISELQSFTSISMPIQVNGVAQLHSDILKAELFSDYVSVWPTKFQNKTNGITPRRWLSFCSPELSHIITKWLETDQWVSNLDLLTKLRQVCEEIYANILDIIVNFLLIAL